MTVLKNKKFSNKIRELILGSILGDGSLKKQKKYKNVRFQERHSVEQIDYFNWKVEQLKELCSNKAVHLQKPDGYSKKSKLKLQTLTWPWLTDLHNECYNKHNNLNFRGEWLNTLTPFSLMVWWCDDGSLIGEGSRKGRMHTEGFNYEDVVLLQNYLRTKWNINSNVGKVKLKNNVYYVLNFSTFNLIKFLRIFIHLIPVKSMIKKVFLRYKNKKLQQRWISDLKNLLPQFEDQIDLLQKQKNLKSENDIVH